MRKILLATTILAGMAFAGAVQAGPVSVNVGGYDDVRLGFFNNFTKGETTNNRGVSMDNEFRLNVNATGKAVNGLQYGGTISLWNGEDLANSYMDQADKISLKQASVHVSGAFGKVSLGDETGATDLFVYAPTVGGGQFDGVYYDFTNSKKVARMFASGVDNTEHSTKATYTSPKVKLMGGKAGDMQVAVSYIPNFNSYGDSVVLTTKGSTIADVVKAAAQYNNSFGKVNFTLSGESLRGDGGNGVQDFVTWGVGTQMGYKGATIGASYADNGTFGAKDGEGKKQNVWTVGGKYDLSKTSVAVNYLQGKGYNQMLAGTKLVTTVTGENTSTANQAVVGGYVSDYTAIGAGATYNWFPGLTTAVDAVSFKQKVQGFDNDKTRGYVVTLSQKMVF